MHPYPKNFFIYEDDLNPGGAFFFVQKSGSLSYSGYRTSVETDSHTLKTLKVRSSESFKRLKRESLGGQGLQVFKRFNRCLDISSVIGIWIPTKIFLVPRNRVPVITQFGIAESHIVRLPGYIICRLLHSNPTRKLCLLRPILETTAPSPQVCLGCLHR
jgi:hypothetical protein